MEENIDDSVKFERYHLINKVYGPCYSKNIRPAPDPHFLLDKFYGDLTIEQYRTLLETPPIFVNKPITWLCPEIRQEKVDHIPSQSVYKVKLASEHQVGVSKNELLQAVFKKRVPRGSINGTEH